MVFNFLGEIFSERSFWRMIIFKLISCPSFQNNEIDQNQPKSTEFEQIRKVIAFKNCRKSMIGKNCISLSFVFLLILSKIKHFIEKSKVIIYKNARFLQKFEPFHKYPSIILAIIFVSKVVHSFWGPSDHFGE